MTIEATIVADSINPTDNRLTTWVLRYPRSIHSELMTHRVLSRNSASSRAIPIKTMIERIELDPFIPHYWPIEEGGMAVTKFVDNPTEIAVLTAEWLAVRDRAISAARWMRETHHIHKSIPNRLLEPWMHIEVVVSATEWNNWYRLRDDKDAEPHLRDLAHMMREIQAKSEPVHRTPLFRGFYPCEVTTKLDPLSAVVAADQDEWHLPFTTRATDIYSRIKESIAHCYWVSYGNVEGKPNFTMEDVERVYKNVTSTPPHVSPAEHVAVTCNAAHRHGNFVGWAQWRKFLPGESGGDYNAA